MVSKKSGNGEGLQPGKILWIPVPKTRLPSTFVGKPFFFKYFKMGIFRPTQQSHLSLALVVAIVLRWSPMYPRLAFTLFLSPGPKLGL